MISQIPTKDALQQELNRTRWTNQRQQLLKKLWRIRREEASQEQQSAGPDHDEPQRAAS